MIWRLSLTIIMLSLFPTAVITMYIIIRFRKKKLNISLFFKMLILGSLSVIPTAFIVSLTTKYAGNSNLSVYFIKPFLSVALVEEFIKFSILIFLLYRNISFKTVKDGMIYSIAISIGFAFFENIIYQTGAGDQISLFISRSITTVPLHALCGAFMGFYTGVSKENEKNFLWKALFSAVFIHGLYNMIIIFPVPYNLISIAIIIISILILRKLYIKNLHIHDKF